MPSHAAVEASNLGMLRVSATGRQLNQYRLSNTRPYLISKFQGKRMLVHRYVIEAFKGASSLECNHINGQREDNRISNLEYVTHVGNVQHAYDTGLNNKVRSASSKAWKKMHAQGAIHHHRGVDHPFAKVNDEIVRSIRSSSESSVAIAKRYGMNSRTIRNIRERKTWRHVA